MLLLKQMGQLGRIKMTRLMVGKCIKSIKQYQKYSYLKKVLETTEEYTRMIALGIKPTEVNIELDEKFREYGLLRLTIMFIYSADNQVQVVIRNIDCTNKFLDCLYDTSWRGIMANKYTVVEQEGELTESQLKVLLNNNLPVYLATRLYTSLYLNKLELTMKLKREILNNIIIFENIDGIRVNHLMMTFGYTAISRESRRELLMKLLEILKTKQMNKYRVELVIMEYGWKLMDVINGYLSTLYKSEIEFEDNLISFNKRYYLKDDLIKMIHQSSLGVRVEVVSNGRNF